MAFVERSRRRGGVERALQRFGLESLQRRRVDRLSMGQRQRVRLAMTFLHEPPLVLLDEPGTSLDEQGLELLDAALAEVATRGGAVLCCSPPNAPVLRADAAYLLEGGRFERS